MKKLSIMFALLAITVVATAQMPTEYNRKGDEALKSLDYNSAKIWFEEGVSYCDSHSIDKLTTIWLADSSMHAVMRSVMSRCLACLDGRASQDNDTTSMIMLIKYYSEGIGTNKNETKADMWASRLEEIREPSQTTYGQNEIKVKREKVKMEFFVGYAATYEAPFGLTVGGVGRVVGWYLRYRTNLSFQSYDESRFELVKTDDPNVYEPRIIGGLDGSLADFTGNKKYNTYAGTGGLVFKIAPSFYISVGGGIGKKEFLAEYHKVNITETNYDPSGPFWAKSGYVDKTSFDGAVVELDGTFKIGKSFYGSLGCTMFDFKYISANAGIGVFF